MLRKGFKTFNGCLSTKLIYLRANASLLKVNATSFATKNVNKMSKDQLINYPNEDGDSLKFYTKQLKAKSTNSVSSVSKISELHKGKEEILSFRQFGFLPEIYKVLDRLKVIAPTSIQSVALPKILQKKHVFFTAQTGTGKTFCYALPLLHDLKLSEQTQKERLTMEKRPRALIIVPTRELAVQVEEVLKEFIHEVPLKIEAFYVGKKYLSEKKSASDGLDIVIATPERFKNHWFKGNVFATKLSHVVFDDLDTLLDAGNEELIKKILDSFFKESEDKITKQAFFCSATTTKNINNFMKEIFPENDPNYVQLIDKCTNVNLSNIKHEFIHVTDYDKYPTLLKILKEYSKYFKLQYSLMLFCNSINCARKTELYLAENGFKTASLHGDIPPLKRKLEMMKFKNRSSKILVCTDLASRGLDFPFVYMVLNFDFPNTVADYIHRAGRTGRNGKKGVVVSFFRQRNMSLIDQIKHANDYNLPVNVENSSFSLKNKELFDNIKDKRPLSRKISQTNLTTTNKTTKSLRKKSTNVNIKTLPFEKKLAIKERATLKTHRKRQLTNKKLEENKDKSERKSQVLKIKGEIAKNKLKYIIRNNKKV